MSAISSYKTHGVTRKHVAFMCINMFHYPAEYRDTLEDYFILHWNGQHYSSRLRDGVVTVSDVCGSREYIVVYQDCTPFCAKRAHELKLSFRKPVDSYDINGYVIVRVLKEKL